MKTNPQIIYVGEEDSFENGVAFVSMRMIASTRLDLEE